jgi:hypothetical protein
MLKRLAKVLTMTMCVLGMCLVLGLLTSQKVRAAAATLVTVSNTKVNPVITERADNPAFQPFFTRVFPSPGAAPSFQVPANKILVIKQVSGFAYSNTVTDIEVYANSGSGDATATAVLPFTIIKGGTSYAFQQTSMTAPAGGTVFISVGDTNPTDFGGQNVDINGYLVDAN